MTFCANEQGESSWRGVRLRPDRAGRLHVGHASVAEAVSGLRHMNGFPGGPPLERRCPLYTWLQMFAAQGALAALYWRTVTGEGQVSTPH